MYPEHHFWPALYAEKPQELVSGLCNLAQVPGLAAVFSNWYIDRLRKTVACANLCINKRCVLLLGEDQVIPLDGNTKLGRVKMIELNRALSEASSLETGKARLRNGLLMAIQLVEFTRRQEPYAPWRCLSPKSSATPVVLNRQQAKVEDIVLYVNSCISRCYEQDFGRFLYVAGKPGTGKTTWAKWCIEKAMMQTNWDCEEIEPVFTSLVCNECSTWSGILREIRNKCSLSGKEELSCALLNQTQRGKKIFAFLLLDEVDQLDHSSRKHKLIMKNLMEWTNSKDKCMRFLVLATGNTFNFGFHKFLPEKLDLQLKRVLMPSYGWEDLEKIMRALKPNEVCYFEPVAVTFIAKIVGNGDGDARKALNILESALWEHGLNGEGTPLIAIRQVKNTMILESESTTGAFDLLAPLPKWLVLVIACLTKKALSRKRLPDEPHVGVDCWKVRKLFEHVVQAHYSEDASHCVDDLFTMPYDCGIIEYESGNDGKCPNEEETVSLRWSIAELERQLDNKLRLFYERAHHACDSLHSLWEA